MASNIAVFLSHFGNGKFWPLNTGRKVLCMPVQTRSEGFLPKAQHVRILRFRTISLQPKHWRWTVGQCSGDKPLFIRDAEHFLSAVNGFVAIRHVVPLSA